MSHESENVDEVVNRDPTGLAARLRAARDEPWKAALPPSMVELLSAAPDRMAVLRRVIGGGDVPILDTGEDAEPVQPVRRTRQRSVPDNVEPGTMLRLDVAAALMFPDGSMTVAALRREADQGRLLIYRIANKDFTTLNDIQEMTSKCRVQVKAHGSTSRRRGTGNGSGSSATASEVSAQAALRATAKALRENLPNTSPASTTPKPAGAAVIPIRLK